MKSTGISSKHPDSLLRGRLGIFEKRNFKPTLGVDGTSDQVTRLKAAGGTLQQQRMIRDKRKTLDRAVWFSYQGAKIQKIGQNHFCRALINPNKLKQDYDDKIVSVGYEYRYQPGDIFD